MQKETLYKPKKSQEHSGNLVKKIKGQTFKEICNFLQIEQEQLKLFFIEHHIEIKNYEDSLENIAKENDYDPLKFLATIISIDITHKKTKG